MNIVYSTSPDGQVWPKPASYLQLFQPVVYEYRFVNTYGTSPANIQTQLDKAAAEGFTFLYGRDSYILLSRTVAPS